MANTNAPFGFKHVGTISGAAPTFVQQERLIASTDSQAVFFGDVVYAVNTPATGYVTGGAAPGSGNPVGIFVGCQYNSVSQQRIVNSRYYPGSDANGPVTAYLITDPGALFLVQTDSSGCTFAQVGQNATFTYAAGSTTTQESAEVLTGISTSASLPFTIVELVTDPAGDNGTDATSGYNKVIVAFNQQIFKAGVASVA